MSGGGLLLLSSVCEFVVSVRSSPFAVVPPFDRSLFTDPEDVVLSLFAEVVGIVLGVWLLMMLLLPLKMFLLLAARDSAVR